MKPRERSSVSAAALTVSARRSASATAAAVTSSTLTAGRPTKRASIRASSVQATSARAAHTATCASWSQRFRSEFILASLPMRRSRPNLASDPQGACGTDATSARRRKARHRAPPSRSRSGSGQAGLARSGPSETGRTAGRLAARTSPSRLRAAHSCRAPDIASPSPNGSRLAPLAGNDATGGLLATRHRVPIRPRRTVDRGARFQRGRRRERKPEGHPAKADRRPHRPAGIAEETAARGPGAPEFRPAG